MSYDDGLKVGLWDTAFASVAMLARKRMDEKEKKDFDHHLISFLAL